MSNYVRRLAYGAARNNVTRVVFYRKNEDDIVQVK